MPSNDENNLYHTYYRSMKIIFNIVYRTNWGEEVRISGLFPESTIDIPAAEGDFEYRYFVRNDDGSVKDEWGHGNRFAASGEGTYRIYDRWQDQPLDKPLYSSLFTDCVCRQDTTDKAVVPVRGFITLSVAAPMVDGRHVLAVSGNTDALGNWDASRAVRMSNMTFPLWQANIPAECLASSTEYKFLILDRATGNVIAWEGGENRHIGSPVNAGEAQCLMACVSSTRYAPGAAPELPYLSSLSAAATTWVSATSTTSSV